MIHPGNLLNDTYEIVERLGSGGSGIIYKAYHRRMRKFVAVKLIKDEIKGDLHNRAEVDVLKNLKNDYLPQVHDFVEDGNEIYTVMEFIEGQNFKQLISNGKKFNETQARKYALQLCEAVEYLHNHIPPIIHSDIKPANVMLTPQDNICLIDFNISMAADNGFVKSKGGSVNFGAPEQFRRLINVPLEIDEFHEETRFVSDDDDTEILLDDERSESNIKTQNTGRAYIDIRTDIYGIGATLYYIATGRIPGSGKPNFRGIKISSQMQMVISKAMSADPTDRYKNVTSMKKALKSKVNFKVLLMPAAAAIAALCLFGIIKALPKNSNMDNTVSEIQIKSTEASVSEMVISEQTSTVTTATPVLTISETSDFEEWSIDEFYKEMFNAINAERAELGNDELAYDNDMCAVCEEICGDMVNGTYEKGTGNEYIKGYFDSCHTYYEETFDLKFYASEREAATALLKYEAENFSSKWRDDVYTHFGIYAFENDDGTFFIHWGTAYNYEQIKVKGVEYSVGLTELNLSGKKLENDDIKILSKMTNLRSLDLSNNNISDISALGGLTNITYLNLDNNKISDISAIENIKCLETLWLNNNSVSDISVLANMKSLKSLNISGNKISEEKIKILKAFLPDCTIYS